MVHFSLEQLSVLMELLKTVPLEVGVWQTFWRLGSDEHIIFNRTLVN